MPSPPRPVGFPGCRNCAYRVAGPPRVCVACMEAATGTPGARPACGACGRPGPVGRPCANPLCGRADRRWSVVWALGTHDGGLRRAIAAYKFDGERWWAPVFARLLAGYLCAHPTWFEEFDRIVAMPAYCGPGSRRDWDPVGTVVAGMATLLGPAWDVDTGAVVKEAETPPMWGRSRRERVALAEGPLRRALRVPDPGRVRGARIIVVDDILTEGSSLREVAMALTDAGAEEVAGLVLGRRQGRDPGAAA